MSGAEMSGAETARRRVVQRRIGGAESAAPRRRRRNGPTPKRVGLPQMGRVCLATVGSNKSQKLRPHQSIFQERRSFFI